MLTRNLFFWELVAGFTEVSCHRLRLNYDNTNNSSCSFVWPDYYENTPSICYMWLHKTKINSCRNSFWNWLLFSITVSFSLLFGLHLFHLLEQILLDSPLWQIRSILVAIDMSPLRSAVMTSPLSSFHFYDHHSWYMLYVWPAFSPNFSYLSRSGLKWLQYIDGGGEGREMYQ